ncbi:hypothetical protein LWC34_42715 [Kibdelosporangium philippinense]|uniref:Secreted protein n=1 Tax=Kibdelosporangium philippinense TaxID=211113 RepID=A0ABS8ZNZ9_9PSEU|nr:hypothetical protein [Kibdelosporangium philippinense]MCE7009480.1 hypothetical protein [Kibdelosporangium philippinense]
MNSKRPWIIAGVTTFALAGFGAAAAMADDDGGSTVRDPHPAPVVQQFDAPLTQTQNGVVDNSPESADSPTASVVDSVDDPALDTANSPDDKVTAPAANVQKEAKAPQQKKAPVDSVDSTGSAG